MLATDEIPPAGSLPELLAFMSERSQRVRSMSFSRQWTFLPQQIVPITATKPADSAPPGMIRIPGGSYDFDVRGIEIEGGNDPGVDVQYPWEDSPRRFHHHRIEIRSFYIDRTPVTNAEFKKFLDATHYHPADDHNFLRDWKNGTYPDGWDSKPVTWVSIEDARAYAAWAGKRLPNDWEWQYAAQANDGRIYPWGNDWNARGSAASRSWPHDARADGRERVRAMERAPSACLISKATCRSGRTNFATSTRARRSFAAGVTTSRAARSGISRRRTASTNTRNIC